MDVIRHGGVDFFMNQGQFVAQTSVLLVVAFAGDIGYVRGVYIGVCAQPKIVRKRQSRLKVLDAEYDERARIQSVIWECEQGIWLS